MREQKDLLRQTRDYLLAGRFFAAGAHILAAVSGGRDSCVMLHILHALRSEMGFTLSVAHYDHNLRPASAAEQQFVREIATNYGLDFYAGAAGAGHKSTQNSKLKTQNWPAKQATSEDAARRARYAFLRQAALQAGAHFIATAHHAQDQAETLLLHLLRGSGLEGLAAIAPQEGDLLRPLLFAAPRRIEEYCLAHDLPFCQDESNADTRYLRNHIRLNILPQLLQINPRLLNSLSATADICREDNAFLDGGADMALAELWLPQQQAVGEGIFSLPPAMQRRILRKAVNNVAGEDIILSYAQTEAALNLQEEQSTSINGGWLIYRRGALFISRVQPPLPAHEEIISVIIDGNWHELAEWGWAYQAVCGPATALPPDSIALPLPMAADICFRTRRRGDAVASRGNRGRKKLKDIFIEKKIPPYQRISWPLLLAKEEIIWLPRLYKHAPEAGGTAVIINIRRNSHL